MRKIIAYLKEYFQNYAHGKLYAVTTIFLVISIFIEYTYNFRATYIDKYENWYTQWMVVTLFYAVPYLFIALFIHVFNIRRNFLKTPSFWGKALIGFAILGFDQSYLPSVIIKSGLKNHNLYFYFTVYSWLVSLLFIVIPLIILNLIIENKKGRNMYGLLIRKFDIKPYAWLLFFAAIFLFAGSFLDDVRSYYPQYLHSGGANFSAFNEINEWIAVALYEFAYATSFISVEHFFRGFLVLGFVRYLRGYAIVPMVACYCFLHFGKPIGETISAIAGGYILGVFVYKTRNIWGGIILHIGIALLMELFGYWRH